MATNHWLPGDTSRAMSIWEEYQRTHDVSSLRGKAAGIDPRSGRVWFGEDSIDILEQMEKAGLSGLFYCVRVGQDHYLEKGGRG